MSKGFIGSFLGVMGDTFITSSGVRVPIKNVFGIRKGNDNDGFYVLFEYTDCLGRHKTVREKMNSENDLECYCNAMKAEPLLYDKLYKV